MAIAVMDFPSTTYDPAIDDKFEAMLQTIWYAWNYLLIKLKQEFSMNQNINNSKTCQCWYHVRIKEKGSHAYGKFSTDSKNIDVL